WANSCVMSITLSSLLVLVLRLPATAWRAVSAGCHPASSDGIVVVKGQNTVLRGCGAWGGGSLPHPVEPEPASEVEECRRLYPVHLHEVPGGEPVSVLEVRRDRFAQLVQPPHDSHRGAAGAE